MKCFGQFSVAMVATLAGALLASGCGNDDANTPGPDTAVADTGSGDTTIDTTQDSASADTAADTGGGDDSQGDTSADATDSTDPTDVDQDTGSTDGDTAADTAGDTVADTADDTAADTAADTSSDSTGDSTGDSADSGDTGTVTQISIHETACSKDGDCLIPCVTSGSCKEGVCSYTAKSGVCLVAAGAGKVGCYPPGAKDDATPCLSCNPSVATDHLSSLQTLYAIDGADHGFQIAELTGVTGNISWTTSAKRAISGGTSLYFGDATSTTYANDKQVHASATSPTVSVPNFAGVKPTLSFWLYLDTEESDGYDVLSVSAVDGEAVTSLWTSDSIGGTTHKVWQLVHVDVSAYAGKDLKFRFEFDSKDGFVNAFEGVYLDDVSIRTGCCGAVSDCDDGNSCTTDSCGATSASAGLPVCAQQTKDACCSSSADCDDNKPCTLDICSGDGGTCSHNAKPDCCETGADCDDSNACTIDHCPKAGSTCQHTDTCCKADGECVSADSCLKGACSGGECVYASVCCLKDAECDDFNPCTVDSCSAGKCVHTGSVQPGCCSPQPFASTFTSGLDGWTSDAPVATLQWFYDKFPYDEDGKKGDGAALLGVPGKEMSGIVGSSNYVMLKSPDITLPPAQEVTFSFKTRFDVSYKTSLQNVTAYIVHQGKQNTLGSVSWATSGKDGWLTFEKDVSSLAGETFQVWLRGRIYGSGSGTSGKGIWVDDVKFEATCSPKKCTTSSACPSVSQCLAGICSDGLCGFQNSCCATNDDCKSENLCIAGTCSSGKCSFKSTVGCCMGAGDCDDGNPCTADVCPAPGQQCQHNPIPGCCLSSSACNDNDKCTEDSCIANTCSNKNFCCKVDKDCDDGETKCTKDTCGNDGICVHAQTGAPGCCEPLPYQDDFEKGAGSWTFANGSGPTKGWQVVGSALQSKSPKGALYYGDPATGNYNFGANKGTATSPSIGVPTGYKSQLTFSVYMDTESGTSYDKLTVSLVVAGAKTTVFTKTASGFTTKKWYDVKVDTSAHAGKSVQLVFDFDTGDSVANSTQGVFVDDVKLTVDCGP